MSRSPDPDLARTRAEDNPAQAETARQFETLWESALEGGPIPDLSSMLGQAPPEQRSSIEDQLTEIDRSYRARIGSSRLATEKTSEWQTAPEEDASRVTLDDGQTHPLPEENDSTPRATVAGYDILDELGRGGMGVVYLARQHGLDRLVALKMILSGGHASSRDADRFRAEAQAVARLQHPNIVQIFEVGEQDGLPYFSLEYVDGQSLEEFRDGKPLSPTKAATLVRTLALAVAEAHRADIVHRDLKPANILLTQTGVPKVTDFGLVKKLDDSGSTGTGTIMGTPSYMAPEQGRGDKNVGPAADVYALGGILYALLTGRPPFLGASAMATIQQMLDKEPVPPRMFQSDVPKDLDTICLKCLEKEPGKRYDSASALADDLERFAKGEPIHARPVSRTERVWRWCLRNRALATAGAGVLALLVALLVGGWLSALWIDKERRVATDNEREARHFARVAEDNADKAKKNAERAEKERKSAIEQRANAVTQRDVAVKAIEVLAHESQKYLFDVPRTQKLQKRLLRLAMEQLDKITATGGKTFQSDLALARAHRRLGDLLLEIGEYQKAYSQYWHCHAVVEEMAKKGHPTKPAVPHLNLGRSYALLGKAELRWGKIDAAKKHFEQSLASRQAALPLGNDKFLCELEIADAQSHLGEVALAMGKPKDARELFLAVIPVRERWAKGAKKEPGKAKGELAGTYMELGRTHLHLEQRKESLEWYGKARTILEQLDKALPNSVSGQANLAACELNMGDVELFTGHPKEAKVLYESAVERLVAMTKKDPDNRSLQRQLGSARYRMGAVEVALGNETAAKKAFDACVTLRQSLYEFDPADIRSRTALMVVLARTPAKEKALELAAGIEKEQGDDPRTLYHLACCYSLLSEQDEPFADKAIDTLKKALEKGYAGRTMLKLEPDFIPLRKHAEFRELTKPVEE